MGTGAAPACMAGALEAIEELAGYVADLDAAGLPAAALGAGLAGMERIDAVLAAARARLVAAYDWTGPCPWTARWRGPRCCTASSRRSARRWWPRC
jgi:hypothetical protein